MTEIDVDDEAVYAHAFVLAEAVRVFLARKQTQRVIAAGILPDDETRALVEASETMSALRLHRVENARGAS